MPETEFTDSFLDELYKRTTSLEDKSTTGNVWIQISLQGASSNLVGELEEFLCNNKDIFKLHIRGMDYSVELLDCDSPLNAYKKSNLLKPQ